MNFFLNVARWWLDGRSGITSTRRRSASSASSAQIARRSALVTSNVMWIDPQLCRAKILKINRDWRDLDIFFSKLSIFYAEARFTATALLLLRVHAQECVSDSRYLIHSQISKSFSLAHQFAYIRTISTSHQDSEKWLTSRVNELLISQVTTCQNQ